MRKHFVRFLSPGTFFSEMSSRPIESWDIVKACQMAGEITERYGATPYAFQFGTNLVADPVDDGEGGKLEVEPKEVARSDNYFLGGTVFSYDDIVARNDPKETILRSNMQGNGWWFVVENNNSWRSLQPFNHGDVVVDPATGEITERGDSGDRQSYRKRMKAEREAELAKYR